jgi:hypothetical protein
MAARLRKAHSEALEHLIEVPPSYPLRTCTCGYKHECPRLDPRENGKLSARGRRVMDKDGARPSSDLTVQGGPSPDYRRGDDGDGDHD